MNYNETDETLRKRFDENAEENHKMLDLIEQKVKEHQKILDYLKKAFEKYEKKYPYSDTESDEDK